jgi:hypothetical protein
MALIPPLEDAEFWRELLQTDAEFRACMEQIVGNLEVAIDVPALEVSFSLSAAIDVRIADLEVQLGAITAEIPCIDIILDKLAGETNPDAIAWRVTMEAEKARLLAEQLSIEGQLEVLPAFSLSTGEQTENLITTGNNSSFLGGILDDLSPEARRVRNAEWTEETGGAGRNADLAWRSGHPGHPSVFGVFDDRTASCPGRAAAHRPSHVRERLSRLESSGPGAGLEVGYRRWTAAGVRGRFVCVRRSHPRPGGSIESLRGVIMAGILDLLTNVLQDDSEKRWDTILLVAQDLQSSTAPERLNSLQNYVETLTAEIDQVNRKRRARRRRTSTKCCPSSMVGSRITRMTSKCGFCGMCWWVGGRR